MRFNFVLGSNMLSQHILARVTLPADDSALNTLHSSGQLMYEGTTVPLKYERRKIYFILKI